MVAKTDIYHLHSRAKKTHTKKKQETLRPFYGYYSFVLNFLRGACSVNPCPLPVTPTLPSNPSGDAKMLPFLIDMDAMLPLDFFLEPFVWNACVFDEERCRFGGGEGRKDGGRGTGDGETAGGGLKLRMGFSVVNFNC